MGCHTRSRREHAGRRELPRLRREAAGRLGLRVLRVVRVGVSKRVAVCTDCGGAASQPANQRDGGWPRAGHRTGCRAALPPPLGAVRYYSSLSGRPRWFRDPHPQQRASRVARNAPGAPWVAAIGAISDCLVTFIIWSTFMRYAAKFTVTSRRGISSRLRMTRAMSGC